MTGMASVRRRPTEGIKAVQILPMTAIAGAATRVVTLPATVGVIAMKIPVGREGAEPQVVVGGPTKTRPPGVEKLRSARHAPTSPHSFKFFLSGPKINPIFITESEGERNLYESDWKFAESFEEEPAARERESSYTELGKG